MAILDLSRFLETFMGRPHRDTEVSHYQMVGFTYQNLRLARRSQGDSVVSAYAARKGIRHWTSRGCESIHRR